MLVGEGWRSVTSELVVEAGHVVAPAGIPGVDPGLCQPGQCPRDRSSGSGSIQCIKLI